MKKIIISVLSAALVFASCQKEAAPVSSGSSEVSFTATIPQTRTSFAPKDGDSYPVLWTGDEKVGVSYNFAAKQSAAVAASADGKTASFEVAFEATADVTDHNFYAVCPYSAFVSASAKYSSLTIEIPSTQTPVDGSCDEAAQIIVAKHESSSFDEKVKFDFNHVVAYGNLSVKLPSGVSGISSITLSSEEDIAGRIFYYPADGSYQVSTNSTSITLNTDKTSEVFFACLPVDLSGKSLKVVVAAGGNTYTKNIDLTGKTLKFEQGRVSKFSVDMSGVSADAKVVYNLVTDPTTLKVGDKVIIAATYKEENYALGTSGTTFRNAAPITVSEATIVNPSDAVEVLTLAKGIEDNTCAFMAGTDYLCASTEDKNNLETQTTLDKYGSFRVTYSDGVTTIKSKGKSTRNIVKFNYNNGAPRFSCYSSGQVDVVIYSDGKGTGAQLFSTAVDAPSTTPTYSSLAELVKAGEPTGGNVNVTLTNEEIRSIYTTASGYRNGIFLQAGDREIEIYCKDVPADWVVGGTVSGTLKDCTWTTFNSTWELCPASWSELTYKAPAGGGVTGNWTRVTTVAELLAGGTFIIGYEATAKSGVIIPMANTGSASTDATGYIYSGSSASSGGKETIYISSVSETSNYEVTIVPSTSVSGAICIKLGANYLGNTNTKNNCQLFTEEAATTAFTPTVGDNDVFTLTIEANDSYNTLQYNAGSPRFAVYKATQKNVVIYKKNK
ncbi:MAG: hypothetical protein SPF58_01600 [Candidatus Cryptobacteroides sp.]|uniref:hypothetical protein n=1 Tax=Candidatus Cryptobacteroides sp. TaxID=2952915 RepID=UPI002A919D7D|nr:hypothetical protein [Candidatus Cryptobacteroides sp.]MDY5565964.1 hypothetical protein [Candidatus Cryptobacteroides sp.]